MKLRKQKRDERRWSHGGIFAREALTDYDPDNHGKRSYAVPKEAYGVIEKVDALSSDELLELMRTTNSAYEALVASAEFLKRHSNVNTTSAHTRLMAFFDFYLSHITWGSRACMEQAMERGDLDGVLKQVFHDFWHSDLLVRMLNGEKPLSDDDYRALIQSRIPSTEADKAQS